MKKIYFKKDDGDEKFNKPFVKVTWLEKDFITTYISE